MSVQQTSIVNGQAKFTRKGRFFQIISAGGIVRVKLTNQGKPVYESLMWVGMNLDQPMDYDGIEFYSETDGIIQFWAGNVAMTLFSFSNDSAKAIRTNRLFVSGIKAVTGTDLTRKELRLRPSKNMGFGGAGIDGDSWTVNAGEILTIPVSGTVFAETEQAKISLGNGLEAEVQDSYDSNIRVGSQFITYGELLVNFANTAQRVFVSGQTVLYSTDGTSWVEHPDFLNSSNTPSYYTRKGVQHPDGTMFIVERNISTNNVKFYRSEDGGLSFQLRKSVAETEQKESAGINTTAYSSSYGKPVIVGELITWCWYSHYFIYNYIKNTWFCVASEQSVTSSSFVAITKNKWLRTTIVGTNTYALQKTEDAGKTWRTIYNAEASYNNGGVVNSLAVSFDGENIYMKRQQSNYPIISKDCGETWTVYPANISASYPKFIRGNKDVWLIQEAGVIKYLDVTNLSSIQTGIEIALPNQTSDTDFQIDKFGQIYVLIYGYSYSWQMSVEGDLSPALVEVMELLA